MVSPGQFSTFFIVFMAMSQVYASDFNFNCAHLVDGYFFDLKPLSRSSSQSDYEVKLENGSNIYFNLCETLNHNDCKGFDDSMANIFYDDGKCGSLTDASKWSNRAVNWKVDAHDYKVKQLIGTYPSTETCQFDTSKNYEFKMKFVCNEDHHHDIKESESTISSDQCSYEVVMESEYACPQFSFSRITRFVNKYYVYFAIAFILLGLFECLWGRKLFKPTLFILVTVFVTGVIFLVVFEYIVPANSSQWIGWVILGAGLIFGLGIAGCLLCFMNVALFVVGAFLGLCVSLIMQNLFLYDIHTHPSDLPFYISFALLGLTFGLLAIWLVDHMLIIATTLIGAYGTIRGVSLFFPGTFPNEFLVADEIHSGEMKQVPWQFYIYLTCIFIMFIGGMVFQYHHKHKEDDDKEAENKYKVMSANSTDEL